MTNNYKIHSSRIRDNRDRAKIIIGVFISMIILSVLSGINSIIFYNKYSNASYAEQLEIQHSPNLVFIMIFGVLAFIMFIVAAITFLNWFRRAYYNIRQFAKKKPSYDDDMAVWSFMIPFVNLVRPFTIATEIYEATYDAAKELSADVPYKNDGIISLWWMLFIVLGIIIALLTKIGGEDTLQEMVDSMLYLGIAELLDIPRLIAAIFMVKTVSKVEAIVYKNRRSFDHAKELTDLSTEEE